MLKISDLSVQIDKKEILKDFNLNINLGEVHAIMGPNGIGKSTICKTLMGDPNYIVTKGSIIFNGENLLKMNINERAIKGIYLVNQNPVEIPGVTNAEMLRMALSIKTGTNVSIFDFNKKMEETCDMLKIPRSFIHRGINEGMSGGERKKNELLHLWMLEPSFIILDELDSGLDVDSLKIVCDSLNKYHQSHKCSILLISHHEQLIKMLNTNYIHILNNGQIVKTGDLTLASQIEKDGYSKFTGTNNVRL
jgi:Fe-S cluster assembly ATP-binding protein